MRLFWSALLCIALSPLATWADTTDDWPEPVYFPQKATQPESEATAAAQKGKQAKPKDPQTSPKQKSLGSKLWPFKGKQEKEKAEFNVVPPKPSAQKADPPASPYPLLRLPMAISTEQGLIPSGIYLVKQAGKPGVPEEEQNALGAGPGKKVLKPEIEVDRPLLLTRQNQIMARIALHAATGPDENEVKTGTPSPLTVADPSLAPTLKVVAQLSADQKSLRLIVTSGARHYESDEYPVMVDTRRQLTF